MGGEFRLLKGDCLRRVFFLIAFLCVLVLSPAAQTISLENALEWGLENSLSLKKSHIDLSTAEYSANRLWSEVFPTISGSVGAGFNSPLFSGDGFAINENTRTLSAGLGVNLTLNAGIPYAMRNIRLAYQTRLLSYEDARNQLEIQITKNFFSLIADRDNLALLADMVNLAQLQHERNQIAFNNGLAGERVLMQSRLGLENARYNLSAARSTYTNRMGEFLSTLGIAGNAPSSEGGPVLEGNVEIAKIEADAQRLILEYLPRRPDIVSRRQEIERLENAERQALVAGRSPSLRLSVDWNSRNFDPFTDSLSGSATLNIPIDPWIPGSKSGQSYRSAASAIEKARLDLQSAEEAAASQIRSLAANLRNSWDSIEIARLSLTIAGRNYELTEQGFRNGTLDSLTLENARNDLAGARQRLLQSELSYLNMLLDLSAALNKNWKELMNEYLPQE
jgi:outer membrane protein